MNPAPDRSRSDRLIPGITQTCTWVVRECTSMSGVPSAERSSEKNYPKMEGLLKTKRITSNGYFCFFSPESEEEDYIHLRLFILQHTWERVGNCSLEMWGRKEVSNEWAVNGISAEIASIRTKVVEVKCVVGIIGLIWHLMAFSDSG